MKDNFVLDLLSGARKDLDKLLYDEAVKRFKKNAPIPMDNQMFQPFNNFAVSPQEAQAKIRAQHPELAPTGKAGIGAGAGFNRTIAELDQAVNKEQGSYWESFAPKNISDPTLTALRNAFNVAGLDPNVKLKDTWNSMPPEKKKEIADLYQADIYKNNVLGSLTQSLQLMEQRSMGEYEQTEGVAKPLKYLENMLLTSMTIPITAFTSPISKKMEGQEVTPEEWAFAGLMGVSFLLPGLPKGVVAKLAPLLIGGMEGLGIKSLKQNWNDMSAEEKSIFISFLAMPVVGGVVAGGKVVPQKVIEALNKAGDKIKPALKEMITSEVGELRLGKGKEEPIKPTPTKLTPAQKKLLDTEMAKVGAEKGTIGESGYVRFEGEGAKTKMVAVPTSEVEAVKAKLFGKPIPQKPTPVTGEIVKAEVVKPTTEEIATPKPPESQIKPVISEEGIKIPVETSKEAPVEVIKTKPSGAESLSFAELQDVPTVIKNATSPDFARKVGNLPVFKQINKALNPSAIAETPVEKFRVARSVLRDEAQQKVQGVMSYLDKLGKAENVFGKIDEKGLFKSGKFKGLSLNELAENPNKFSLTAEQRRWLDQAYEIEKAKLDFLKRHDIEINELSFAEGGRYAGRRVVGKTTQSGELIDVGYIGAGPGRPGAKLGAEKIRYFATAEEARKAGYSYMPYDEALYFNVQAAMNRVTDKMVTDWFLTQVEWRSTSAPEALVIAAELAKLKLNKSQQILASLNRALRGERGVPEQSIKSISTVFPNEAKQLQKLIADIRAGKKTGSGVKQFEAKIKNLIKENKSEYWRAVNARAKAREQALQTHVGEARVEAPAFAGKILTGKNAREIATALRKELSPEASEVLKNINKVNAVTRYFALAGDFSPFGIQLLLEAFNNPKVFIGGMRGFARGMVNDTYIPRLINKYKALIDRHPNLIIASRGTEWTEAFQKGGFLEKGPGKYPGKLLQPFQKGFEAALTEAQLLKAEALEPLAKNAKDIAALDQFVNEFHGMTSSSRLGTSINVRQAESMFLIAPRYFRAIGGLLFDVFRGGVRGKLARESMIKLTAGMVLTSMAIDMARGASTEEMLDRLNPMSSNFFTWTVGGQKIGPGSKIRSVLKLIGDSAEDPENLLRFSMDNPALRFIRGNLSMTVGTAIDLVLGRNFIGEPTRDTVPQLTETIFAENLVPLWLQTLWENGSDITDIQGTSIRLAAQLFGGRAYPESKWDKVKEMRETLSQKVFGKPYEDLNNAQRDELNRKYADLAKIEEEAKKEMAERGTDAQRIYTSVKEQIIKERNNAMELAAQAYLNGDITKKEYDDRRSYVKPYYSGGMNVLWNIKQLLDPESVKDIEEWLAENQKPEDKALDAYWQKYNELLDKAGLPIDWDSINTKLDEFLNGYPPAYKSYILEHKNDSIYDLPPAAQQVELERLKGIEDGTWWDDYRGASKPTLSESSTTKTVEDYLKTLQGGSSGGGKTKTVDDYLKILGK